MSTTLDMSFVLQIFTDFATNSNFIIPIYFQPDGSNLRNFKLLSLISQLSSLISFHLTSFIFHPSSLISDLSSIISNISSLISHLSYLISHL